MKRLLAGGAVLFLALQPVANAAEKWEGDFRQCHIRKWFSKDELAEMTGWEHGTEGQTVIISEDEIKDLEKTIPIIKRCLAFNKCLGERAEGKVKHCYFNDRRWR